jgi:hypothetical protein
MDVVCFLLVQRICEGVHLFANHLVALKKVTCVFLTHTHAPDSLDFLSTGTTEISKRHSTSPQANHDIAPRTNDSICSAMRLSQPL